MKSSQSFSLVLIIFLIIFDTIYANSENGLLADKQYNNSITELNLSLYGLTSIDKLSYFSNLINLFLSANQISDILSIRNLIHLKSLDLSFNKIQTIDSIENFIYN